MTKIPRRVGHRDVIEALIAGEQIKYSPESRQKLVSAVYFRDPELSPEAEERAMALLAEWRVRAG